MWGMVRGCYGIVQGCSNCSKTGKILKFSLLSVESWMSMFRPSWSVTIFKWMSIWTVWIPTPCHMSSCLSWGRRSARSRKGWQRRKLRDWSMWKWKRRKRTVRYAALSYRPTRWGSGWDANTYTTRNAWWSGWRSRTSARYVNSTFWRSTRTTVEGYSQKSMFLNEKIKGSNKLCRLNNDLIDKLCILWITIPII